MGFAVIWSQMDATSALVSALMSKDFRKLFLEGFGGGNGFGFKKSTNLKKTEMHVSKKMAGLLISISSPKKDSEQKNGAKHPMFSLHASKKVDFLWAMFCQDPGAAADVASAAAGVCRDSGDVEGEAGTGFDGMEWS